VTALAASFWHNPRRCFQDGRARPGSILSNDPLPSDAITVLSDESLMSRYQAGDAKAFEVLYRRHRNRLYRYTTRMTATRADADEIFQDVWMAVIRGRSRYSPAARFVTYLFSIAHRRAADKFRIGFREQVRSLETDDEGEASLVNGTEFEPLSAIVNAELGRAIAVAIAALPLAQREAFLMQAEGELSLKEIADATETSRETIKSRLRYANVKLRKALEGWR
jgi:RNA polymerase sigma-70 factor, ECF subfamily